MELSDNIKLIIARQINKSRFVEISPEEVTINEFLEVATNYIKKFGYTPEEWAPYLNNLDIQD